MRKRNITLLTAFAAAAALTPAAQAAPIVTPQDGYTGAYRLAVIMSSRTTADANNPISFYNGIVTTAAAAVTELDDLSTTWTAIASTIAVDARDNTETLAVGVTGYDAAKDVPIYTTDGVRIADDNADLWDGALASRLYYDTGTAHPGGWDGHGFYDSSWTGTKTDGTQTGDGSTNPQDGNALSTGPGSGGNNLTQNRNYVVAGQPGHWIDSATAGGEDSRGHHLMAMSGVIGGTTPAADPEITSITSLGGGNFELKLKGENSTSYQFFSSTTLDFDTGTLVPLTVILGGGGGTDVTTTSSGDATVQMSPGGSVNFVRAVGP